MRWAIFAVLSFMLVNASANPPTQWNGERAHLGSYPNTRIYPSAVGPMPSPSPNAFNGLADTTQVDVIYYAVKAVIDDLDASILDWRINVSEIDDFFGNVANPTTRQYMQQNNNGLDGAYLCDTPDGTTIHCHIVLFYSKSWTGFDGTEVFITFPSAAVEPL